MNREAEKLRAAEAAVRLVEDGMALGLGTGSTAAHALRLLGERVRAGLNVRGVPTSQWALETAEAEGIPVVGFDAVSELDLALDGTDEFDGALNLIKGGGGALFREKIVAAAARRFVVLADASKRVARLGRFPLPVEVIPFGWQVTARRIASLGAQVSLRAGEATPYMTDNQGYILDCAFGEIHDPPALAARLSVIPGVMEHGLFVGMADTVLLAEGDTVHTLRREG